MKLNREKVIREELGESEPNSTLCSGYLSQDGVTPTKQAPAAAGVHTGNGKAPLKPPQIVIEVNGCTAEQGGHVTSQQKSPIYKPRSRNNSMGKKGGNALQAMILQKKLDELKNGGNTPNGVTIANGNAHVATEADTQMLLTSAPLLSNGVNGHRQMSLPLATSPDEFRSSDLWALKSVKNGSAAAAGRRQTAATAAELQIAGHLKEDYSRPMYRKDIFYSGSFLKIPDYKSSQPDVNTYIKSVTSIPEVVEPVREAAIWKACSCLPKPFTDVLKQMFDFSILRDPVFVIACIANMVGFLGIFVPFVFVAKRAEELGVEKGNAALLVSIIGS